MLQVTLHTNSRKKKESYLELLLPLPVELLAASHGLDQLLDHHPVEDGVKQIFLEEHYKYFLPVVDAHIAGVDLDVVVGGDGDDLHLLVARRGEVLVLDPQPLHPRAVQLPRYEDKYYLLLTTAHAK